jgi:hypothetical protein
MILNVTHRLHSAQAERFSCRSLVLLINGQSDPVVGREGVRHWSLKAEFGSHVDRYYVTVMMCPPDRGPFTSFCEFGILSAM